MNISRYFTLHSLARWFGCLSLALLMSFAGVSEAQSKKKKKKKKKKPRQEQTQPEQTQPEQTQPEQTQSNSLSKKDAQTLLRVERKLLAYATQAARTELGDLAKTDNSAAQNALGRIYEQEKNYDEAQRRLEKAGRLAPGDPAPWAHLGEAYLHQKRQAEASTAFREAEKRANALVKKAPSDASAHYYLGLSRGRLKKFAPALESLSRAHQLDPKDPLPVHHMGVIKAAQQKWQEAVDLLSQALTLNSNMAYAYYYRGQSASRLKRKDMLIADLERFLELAPGSPEAPIARRTLDAARR